MVCYSFFNDWALIPQDSLIIGHTPVLWTMQKGPSKFNGEWFNIKCAVHWEKPLILRTKEQSCPSLNKRPSPHYTRKSIALNSIQWKVLFAYTTQWRKLHNRIRGGNVMFREKGELLLNCPQHERLTLLPLATFCFLAGEIPLSMFSVRIDHKQKVPYLLVCL